MAFVSGNGRRAYARPSPLFCPGIEKALIEHIHDMLRANALLTVVFLKPLTLQAARGAGNEKFMASMRWSPVGRRVGGPGDGVEEDA